MEMKKHNVKPALSLEKQVDLLTSKGLIVENRDWALEILSQVSYYRLISAYSLGLYDCSTGNQQRYKRGVTFHQLYDLYQFDCKLRAILFELIEDFEIIFRTKLTNFISIKYGSLGYLDDKISIQKQYHQDFLKTLEREKKIQEKSPIVKHHNDVYQGNMPMWAAAEILPFGTISKFYSNLNKNDQKEIAENFDVRDVYLNSWLRAFVEVRNICAHYGRIYNKHLHSPPRLFNDAKELKNDRIFAVLYILKRYIASNIPKWTSVKLRLEHALSLHKAVEQNKIGFPIDWKKWLE